MGLQDILSPDGIVFDLHARCKREALASLAGKAAEITGVPAETIRESLMAREQLGSTGVGRGVAIPHGKIDGLNEIVGVMAKLDQPVDFDSVDDEPVDLIFVLLAPAHASAAHLKALAKVSRLLKDDASREALKGAESPEALYAIAMETAQPHAA
ncbi:MAG: PTS sugar transporter subunit IIA [Parvularculaceae bacterium]